MPKSDIRHKIIPHSSETKSKTLLRPAGRADSKQARLIAMLRASSGATIPAMIKFTRWQKHSVRGFLAGTVRRKLDLNLVSEESNGSRVYRVRNRKRPPAINKIAKTV